MDRLVAKKAACLPIFDCFQRSGTPFEAGWRNIRSADRLVESCGQSKRFKSSIKELDATAVVCAFFSGSRHGVQNFFGHPVCGLKWEMSIPYPAVLLV